MFNLSVFTTMVWQHLPATAKTIQDVLAEFTDTHTQVMSLIVNIFPVTLRQNGTLPWYGMDYALNDVMVYMYYGHKREHSAQIAAFRDQLDRLHCGERDYAGRCTDSINC